MRKIDVNVDMGESFGRYTLGNDEELMKYISSQCCYLFSRGRSSRYGTDHKVGQTI